MRYSEFHLSSKAGQDAEQSKMTSRSPELSSFMAEDKFVELLWDNGQVVLHDQSGKNRRITTNFPSDISGPYVDRANERDNKDGSMSKSGRLEATDPFLNEFCLPDASYNVEPNAQNGDNDMVPWMNYPIDDSIPHEYYSEFLCDDVPEANFHSISAHVTSVPIHTNNAVGDFSKGSHSTEHGNTSKICAHGSDPLRARISHFNELPQQSQASVIPGIKSKAEDFYIGGDNDGHKGLSESFDGGKSQKQDLLTGKPLHPSTVGVMNFSHFSKPAALAMASLRNVGKLKSNENPSIPSIVTNNKNLEPAVIQCGTKDNFQCGSKRKLDPVPTKLCHESSVKTSKQIACFENSKANCHGNKNSNATKRNSDGENKSIDHNSRWGSNFTAGLPLTRSDTKKGPEGIVATSSVCSGISAGAISNEPKHRDKRKVQEAEESSSHSDDFEDELVGQTKSATTSKGPSTKRSRAAEVHNLSERRRRDRINEKMRALQELIPNCSKVDKASMLDEAIEYLKTLQLQVQMMSMGNSLCIAPMMLPGGMQHMGMPPFPNFSQIGLGMGMGMRLGYGMGMVDMNGSPNYTLLSLPPMHRPQYHCSAPPVSAVLGMQGVPASMAPMFGIPGQGLPVSATPASTGNPASDLPPPPISSGAETNPMHALNTRPSSSYADQQQEQSGKLEVMQNCGTEASKLPGCH